MFPSCHTFTPWASLLGIEREGRVRGTGTLPLMADERIGGAPRSGGIFGIGVDTVVVSRFEEQLVRTPKLRERLFTPSERELPIRSLAARFAAKEALIKALGGSDGVEWQDMEILRVSDERPRFSPTSALHTILNERNCLDPHLSITHDGDIATAFVVIENRSKASQA